MEIRISPRAWLLINASVVAILLLPVRAPRAAEPVFKLPTSVPILAIWRDSQGFAPGAPYLRIAIWEDGRVLFAPNASKWGHSIREGRLSQEAVADLKRSVAATGVFDLKGNCYLVPDAPVDCITVQFGSHKQTLYWDEVESAGYGINTNPKPQHRKFKETWKTVNRLALGTRPAAGKPVAGRIQQVPRSWLLKPMAQSE